MMQETSSSAMRGPLIVVSGPSGVGKTTVVSRVVESSELPLRRVITATTRAPRPSEQDDRDYHFWSPERFQSAVDQGEMLEHARYGGQWYGTPRAEVEPYRSQGKGVILVIDVQGAEQVRQAYPNDHLSVFLNPPSQEELFRRLRLRATEAGTQLEKRLEIAQREMAKAHEFDVQLINATLDDTVQDLQAIIRQQFAKRGMI